MAKELYFPLESGGQYLSKKTKEIYFPLLTNGQYLSKKAIKAYCSVNGVSKLFWDGGGGGMSVRVKTRIRDVYSGLNTNVSVKTSIRDVYTGLDQTVNITTSIRNYP